MNIHETITAIATASGEAGISIVRISGPDCLAIADRIFRCAGAPPSQRATRSMVLGHIVHEGQTLDQVLLLIMRAPNSYTCEDVVEIHGHGGNACARRILRAAMDAGARLAEPGEFTQRAFLNGRLDLVQAEAVLDLIHARSDRAASAALDQLEGGLSTKFNVLYDLILHLAADLEATLDFPEDELPEAVMPELVRRTAHVLDLTRQLIATWDEGHLLRDGALVVISGKPNVGKSTLLNALLGTDRAIVSDMPGTTRDTIEEDFVLAGIPIRLIDTAGLRETECLIEKKGIERTRTRMAKADLHIYMIDASQPLSDDDRAHIRGIPDGKGLVILNKIDLGDAIAEWPYAPPLVKASMNNVDDLKTIRTALEGLLSSRLDLAARPQAAISERHRALLLEATREMEAVAELLAEEADAVVSLAASRLRTALDALGTVTGRTYQEELLNSIFSRFCIGK